jgi:broad specificity phosphatase PhoE
VTVTRPAALSRVGNLGPLRRVRLPARSGRFVALLPAVDAGLKERDVGAFSGRLTADLIHEFPDAFDPETRRARYVPGGEPDDVVLARVTAALVGLVDRFPDDRLLAVSHGGVIRLLERHLDVDPGVATPNLGGRWLIVDDGELHAGERFVPLETDLVTDSRTE